jgi:Sap, sulfolipid-1-addressing protein
MWCTVLMLALVATLDPVRLGTSVFLYSRPRPVRHLIAFWLGGVTVGVVLAVAVLVGMRDAAFGVVHRLQLAAASSTAGHIQIALGALALLVAALALGLSARQRARLETAAPVPPQLQPRTSTAFSRLSTRAQGILHTRPLWVPFAMGVGLFTDFRYLLALSAIVASGAAAGTQISATAAFAVVSLAFIEIPLASRLAAPVKTGEVMSQVHEWVYARRHQVFAAIVAVLGVFLMSTGLGHV